MMLYPEWLIAALKAAAYTIVLSIALAVVVRILLLLGDR